ncbi:unnamed protein product [Didymodactylos carnosus]|uniref:Uncharacterized protein n=2 Tax=Didymodactylos carnosus TaxID=1234261 RepID=A0A815LLT2_9BILA|nr:unnamed protein product [Didymodactylos carnosus]CAF4300030.1 unnamed protein product [Didymodactylos carnosus]
MLKGCLFNYKPCLEEDFISFTSPNYGPCYIFNAKLKNSTDDNVRYTNQYGQYGVPSLVLYVHSHQCIPYTTDSAGVVVIIHDNTQLPMIETSDIELAPGKRHRLNYKKKKSNFFSSPYSTCANQPSSVIMDMFENYNDADYGYSRMICRGLCLMVLQYRMLFLSLLVWSGRGMYVIEHIQLDNPW